MKEPRSIDREIQVVETIINQLNSCLTIYRKNEMHDEFKITLKDIITCKQELNRLIAKRNLANITD